MKKQRVIIDTDPGIDDSLAMMYALSSKEIEVIGITIVCGNVPVEIGVQNAWKVLKLMGRLDIPVYVGAKKPLVRDYISAQDTHGMDGLGESKLQEVKGIVYEDAAGFITDRLRNEKDVSILAIGPLTNIAHALRRDKEAFLTMDRFVSMGGSFKSHGNCSPVAEYNYWCDPDAANEVFHTFGELGKRVEMVGLDVTRKIVLTPNILNYLKRIHKERGEFVEKIVQFYFDFHWEYEGIIGCVINDPLAIAYFIEPSICEGFDSYTMVETKGTCIGQSVVDAMNFWKKDANSRILTQVDEKEFMLQFIHRIFGGEKEAIKAMLSQIMVEN